MALDEPQDTDDVYDIEGFKYVVNKDFLEKAQPIKVDFLINGFKLDCGIEFGPASACSSCSTSGTCG